MKLIYGLIVSLVLMGSLALGAPGYYYTMPIAQPVTDGSHTVWQDAQIKLQRIGSYPLNSEERILLVAKYPTSSDSQKFIEQSKGLLLRQDYDFNQRMALLEIQNMEQLNLIAQLVHQDTHRCGMLQIINNNLVKPITTITPPWYSPLATLSEIANLMDTPSSSEIIDVIGDLSGLTTRHHSTDTLASDFVGDIFSTIAANRSDIVIEKKSHSFTGQQSVIARIPGQSTSEQIVVIGAHLDSINRAGIDSPAPGADDDASGVAILAEILRVISNEQLSFARTVELQAYAAEEVGLIGSGEIAKNSDTTISMMQIDMAMYGSEENQGRIFLVHDDTSANMRRHSMHFLNNYVKAPYSSASLPQGATSDHRSFYQQGIPTLFPFEDTLDYNTKIHSADDTIAHLNNPSLGLNIAKLGLAYLSHYAGLVSAQGSYDSLKESLLENLEGDIFLGAVASEIDQSYYLSASVSSEIQAVEFCIIDSTSSLDCVQKRYILDQSLVKDSRLIYFSEEAISFTNKDRIRVWAYDFQDSLVFKRDVEINLIN